MRILDLYEIRELMKKESLDSINMGNHSEYKRDFIKKYGIDNIIALDEETNGIFSHTMWGNDIYLTLFAVYDPVVFRNDDEDSSESISSDVSDTYDAVRTGRGYSYSEFENRMCEILQFARKKNRGIEAGTFPDYDFITGRFRDEHSEIFIDGVSTTLKLRFYRGHITAEDVRQNPELIQILQEKDLSRVFINQVAVRTSGENKIENEITSFKLIGLAEFISNKIGKENFLKICADYGKCLDGITLKISEDFTVESLKDLIEDTIYNTIQDSDLEYFETLPVSFKEKHPDLFLPDNISEDLRNKFYSGDLTFEDLRLNPQLIDAILSKDISVGLRKVKYSLLYMYGKETWGVGLLWKRLSEQEILYFAGRYGKFLNDVNPNIFVKGQSTEEKERAVQQNIEENILTRKSPFDETIPEFFKKKYPEFFLDEDTPELLKKLYYKGVHYDSNFGIEMDFRVIGVHSEWRKFLKGKNLRLAFPSNYDELFRLFDSDTLLKLSSKAPENIHKMVTQHREKTLKNWYDATGGKFVPNSVVMLNFPEDEIDSFLVNGRKWSKLMSLDYYSLNDDGKAALLKAAYSFGVFKGDNEAFNKTMDLFEGIPKSLTADEYDEVLEKVMYSDKLQTLLEQAYIRGEDGTYTLNFNSQSDKKRTKEVRDLLEESEFPRMLTPIKAHQIFDSFKMEYNPDFAKFFTNNFDEIISNPEYIGDIATIQRQFGEIVKINAGRKITFDVAQAYVRSIVYSNIDVGNEGVAEQAKIAGYSQEDFEAIQKLFNEGEMRDYSSIPRVKGETRGYTYEMLRCDDPLALTIGTLTNCCQEINGAGETSMEHSVVSPDGRVFCVKDEEGRIVAQSWFWRNQYTGCFDNIEIPGQIFHSYEVSHPDVGRKGLAEEVLAVYKRAAQDLIDEDQKTYQAMLEQGEITQAQYDSLALSKVTIGLGYNDIADAIKSDTTLKEDSDIVMVKDTERLQYTYTDAETQYIVAEADGGTLSKVGSANTDAGNQYTVARAPKVSTKYEQENLYVYQDDIPVYDETNITDTVLLTLRRMNRTSQNDNSSYFYMPEKDENSTHSQRLMDAISYEYGFEPETTKVLATARMAIIYSKANNKVIIGDILSSPLKQGLSEEQQQKAHNHIRNQVKKAIKQMGVQEEQLDMSSLSTEKQQMLKSVIDEIREENDERGAR